MVFSHKALALATLTVAAFGGVAATARAGTNLLVNASFETQGSGTAETAYRWNWNNPDTHGGCWGTFSRRPWPSHSGSWVGALLGRWINRGPDGGAWQEGPVTPGALCEASGWFWTDMSPPPTVQEMKVEFYSASYANLLTVAMNLPTNIVQAYTQCSMRVTAPAGAAWARWVVAVVGAGQNGSLRFDDVELREITLRDQTFNDWTTQSVDGTYTRDGWMISTGKTQTANARSGYCANLGNPGTVSDSGHFIRSAPMADGIGTLNFWYRHETGSGALTYDIQASADGTNWTTIGGITNILNTSYVQFTKFIYEPSKPYLRIYHTAGAGRLLVDDISIALPSAIQRFVDFDDWPATYSSNACYAYAGWDLCTGRMVTANAYAGQSALVAGNVAGGNDLRSPEFSDGIGEIGFVYRAETNTSALSFSVQISTNGTDWATLASYSGVSNLAYTNVHIPFYSPNSRYIRFLHTGGTSTNNLLLDKVNIEEPFLARSQNFNGWPSETSYGGYDFERWHVEDALIDTNNAVAGQSVRLKDTVNSNALIRSPYLVGGVGNISFSYVLDDATAGPSTHVNFDIQTSTDGVSWVTLDTLQDIQFASNLVYQPYSKYVYMTNDAYVQIIHTSGTRRVGFDTIVIDAPTPPADVVIAASTVPMNPYTNDPVTIQAHLLPQYGANELAVTSFYRIGTSGAFTALGMTLSDPVTYSTTSAIPQQAPGTTVQYYLGCWFGGPGSSSNSPRFYPPDGSNGPAFYGIPRNPQGSVWINEINFVNYFFAPQTNEFIELAGAAGSDISGWRIDLAYGSFTSSVPTYANYTIPTNTVLTNEGAGFGFFVLGDVQFGSLCDMLFTNTASANTNDNFADGTPDALQIVNEVGGAECRLSYNGEVLSYQYVGRDNDFVAGNLSLAGTGATYGAFLWATNAYTPGSVNIGQGFPPESIAPPDVWFSTLALGTNITMYYVGNTNNWTVAPYQTTNLSSPQTWSPVTPFFSSTNAVWFDRPATGAQYIFRLTITN
ncbi:MAG: hypothetical protein V1929_10625 [bacterium]